MVEIRLKYVYFFIAFWLNQFNLFSQVTPIIDNGYLSEQGWGAAIHPSGNFIIKADRSIIHAYDRYNKMLFQTFRSPCIAINIFFSPDGNYMIVESEGEIADECNRVVVYDFYSGNILFNKKGATTTVLGKLNKFYFFDNISKPGFINKDGIWEKNIYDTLQTLLEIYDFQNLNIPEKIIYNLGGLTKDTITGVMDVYYGRQEYMLNGGGFNSFSKIYESLKEQMGEDERADFKRAADSGWISVREEVSISTKNLLKINSGIIIDSLFLVPKIEEKYNEDGYVVGMKKQINVYNVYSGNFITKIDSVNMNDYIYSKEDNELTFKGDFVFYTAQVKFSIKNQQIKKEITTAASSLNFTSKKVVYEIDIYEDKIVERNFSLADSSVSSDTIKLIGDIDRVNPYDFFMQTDNRTQILPDKKLVLYNGLVIDLDKNSYWQLRTGIDTNLVHPGIVGIYPYNPGKLTINDFQWNIFGSPQFIKLSKEKYISRKVTSQTEVKKDDNSTKYYLLNQLNKFEYNKINYLQLGNYWIGERNSVLDSNYIKLQKAIREMRLMESGDTVFLEHKGELIVKGLKIPLKIVQKEEAKFRKHIETSFSEIKLNKLNKFPEYSIFNFRDGGLIYDYFKYSERNRLEWYFHPYYVKFTDSVYTKNPSVATSAFVRSLIKPSLNYSFSDKAEPVYSINILNSENGIPLLSMAGVSPKNDIYYSDIMFPLTENRLMSVNYAYGTIKLCDSKGSLITQTSIYRNGEFIHVTHDGYYFATKGRLNRISIRSGNQVFPIEQFELKYHRPDIVLERLGCVNKDLLLGYKSAYLKRLKKMGFTEDMLKDDFHLPEIKIENYEDIPTYYDSPALELKLKMFDSKYELDRINVYLNNVPVFSNRGIDLRNENVKEILKTIEIILTQGTNKVDVSVLNQSGAESYKETVYVTYKPKKAVKPDMYLITIGDSKYKDDRYNLTYAAKDADDIKTAFEKNSAYSNVFTYSYTNEKVTKENILKLKQELLKAKRDDVVIITVAGHGVLDKDLNYYLATYDMDFNNPAEKGLPYEDLESLVDGIAPLKKVIFLDACHSGEVDKEEVEQLAMANTSNSDVKFRAAGAGIQKKSLGLKTTSELMGELFTDLRRGTGATVISSAGGAEYAMESDQWKNGLFTYCLLHGLKDKAADANKDGEIMLSELQQYLRTEVTRLSNGAQQPTSRIENLNMDFRIW